MFKDMNEIYNLPVAKEDIRIGIDIINGEKFYYLKPKLKDLSQGSRLAFVRQFRYLSLDEVADYFKFTGDEKNRTIRRYESNNRVPSDDRLDEFKNLYKVSLDSIKKYDCTSIIDNMYLLLWVEELYPDTFDNFIINEKEYNDINMIMNKFCLEWQKMKQKRNDKEITYGEYIEWKLNFKL